jgi:hypothetical protein
MNTKTQLRAARVFLLLVVTRAKVAKASDQCEAESQQATI